MTARLPTPGSDKGTWGNILNGFLKVSLSSDGSLKTGSVSAAGAELTARKGAASGYASLDSTANVPADQLRNTPDATTSNAGLIQLAGDLGGTATSPTVPGSEKTANKDLPSGYAGLDSSGLIKQSELPGEVANASWFTTVMDPLSIFEFNQGSWSMQSGGGTWSICNSPTPFGGGGAIGDSISTNVKLHAGTYEIDIINWWLPGGGQFNVILDGTTLGNIDMYQSYADPNDVTQFTGISVAASGMHTITFTATGQNANSNGYIVAVQYVQFIKTG